MAVLRFYDPITILAVASAMQVIGGIAQGQAEQVNADNEASFLQAQAINEEEARRREVRDVRLERDRIGGRSRAVLAANGADLSSGSALAILETQASEFGIKESRLRSDSELRAASLRTRASNVKAAGKAAKRRAIFGGISRGVSTFVGGGGGSLLTSGVSSGGSKSTGSVSRTRSG